MIFIGDVHGKFDKYFSLLETIEDKSIQLGDFGMGFHPTPLPWDKKHMFIRGNHDNPDVCRKHPNYLGEYGITENGIFYVGGAFSIDKQYRLDYQAVTGKQVWWADEQIAKEYHAEVLYLYGKEKPKTVVTHDCPACVRKQLSETKEQFKNDTSDGLLQKMFKIHQPKVWIFGHYHKSAKIILDKTTFICLNEYESDPVYHALTDQLEIFIRDAQLSPTEIREIAMLACIHYENRKTKPPLFYTD